MNTPAETLESMAAQTSAIDLDSLAAMPAAELLELTVAVAKLGRVVDGLRVATATTIEQRSDRWLGTAGLAQSYGYRRGFELVEQVTGVSGATARRRIRFGGSIRPRQGALGAMLPAYYPTVSAALSAGRIGTDAAQVIVTELAAAAARAEPDAVERAERVLVALAAGSTDDLAALSEDDQTEAGLGAEVVERLTTGAAVPVGLPLAADLVAMQARLMRDAIDPDGVEPRADVARVNRMVTLSRVPVGGLYPMRGMLTPDLAAALHAYFDVLIKRPGPSFDSDMERLKQGLNMENRTGDQQRHDLLAALVRAAGAATASDAPMPAPLVIRIDSDQARTGGTGSISGIDGPIPESFLRQIACDGGIQLMMMKAGRIVQLGTKGRFFTAQQRRAVACRDGDTCLVPGCDVPFPSLEAHHVDEHRRHGPTHVDNCVLLCWWHHHLIDTGIWTVEMVRGRPRVRMPIRSHLRLVA